MSASWSAGDRLDMVSISSASAAASAIATHIATRRADPDLSSGYTRDRTSGQFHRVEGWDGAETEVRCDHH